MVTAADPAGAPVASGRTGLSERTAGQMDNRRSQPCVDVVIPCYNYGHFLRGCIDSVLSQAGVDVRILVIDDCSTDDSADVARAVASEDERVTARRHEVNRGHIETYNEGLLQWASADYVVLLSADDRLVAGCLRRATDIMQAHPSVGMVYGRSIYFGSDEDLPALEWGDVGNVIWSGRDWIELRCRAGYNVISSPEVVVRTSVHHAVGGYRPSLPHSGDLEMWLRLAAISDVAYVTGAAQALYRVHGASMQRSFFADGLADIRQREAAFASFFASGTGSLPDAGVLQRSAERALARTALDRACWAYERNRVSTTPVEELEEFARSTYSGSDGLREARALRRRKWLGPWICGRTGLFVGNAFLRRIRTRRVWKSIRERGM
jgi:hypothetical protein